MAKVACLLFCVLLWCTTQQFCNASRWSRQQTPEERTLAKGVLTKLRNLIALERNERGKLNTVKKGHNDFRRLSEELEGAQTYNKEAVLPISSHCDLPSDSGPCYAAFPRYFYDSKTKTCNLFTYGGCQGNANNFRSIKTCLQDCGGEDFHTHLDTHVSDDDTTPARCKLPSKTGYCRGHFRRFYYNAGKKVCEEFVYGGCGGNQNRFETVDQCNEICGI